MVNKELLKQRIEDSGLKTSYIAKEMGISRQALHEKVNGKLTLKGSEVYALCALLKIDTQQEKETIFIEN